MVINNDGDDNVNGGTQNKKKQGQTGRTKSKELNPTKITAPDKFTVYSWMHRQVQASKPAGHKQERRKQASKQGKAKDKASEQAPRSERAGRQAGRQRNKLTGKNKNSTTQQFGLFVLH
jgi:hypothetical protein